MDSLLSHAAKCNECFELIGESIRTYKNFQIESLPQLSNEAVKKTEELIRFKEDKTKGSNLFRTNKPLPAFAVLILLMIIDVGRWYYFNVNQKNNSTIELRINNPSDEESLTKNNLVFKWQEIKNAVFYSKKNNWFKEYPYHLQAYKIQKEINDLLGLADTYYFPAYVPIFNKRMMNYEYGYLTRSYNLSLSIGYKWGNIVAGNRLIRFVLQHSSLYPSTQIKKDSIEDNTGDLK